MKLFPVTSTLLAIAVLGGGTTDALAWGERGHHTVCEVAAMLVKEPGLKRFLSSKGHMLGHVCNIPDIYWRSLEAQKDRTKLQTVDDPRVADEAHFINPETAGYKDASQMPLLFTSKVSSEQTVEKDALAYGESNSLKKTPHELAGSNWWRTAQFFNDALEGARKAADITRRVTEAENSPEVVAAKARLEQAKRDREFLPQPEYNRLKNIISRGQKASAPIKKEINAPIKNMIEAMGLMGHFVGDAAQPYHNTANYNGYQTGHGGIHSYYESQIVNRFGADIQQQVYEAAVGGTPQNELKDEAKESFRREIVSFAIDMQNAILTADDRSAKDINEYVVRKMKALSSTSAKQLPLIEAIEESIPGFVKSRGDHGQPQGRPFADQLDEVTFNKYRKLIVAQMATSAAVLAHFWDQAYSKGGSPNLGLYSSYDYPLAPAYRDEKKDNKWMPETKDRAPNYMDWDLNRKVWESHQRAPRLAPPPAQVDQHTETELLLAPPPAEPEHKRE